MAGRLALLAFSVVAGLVMLELGCRLLRGRHNLVHWPNLVLQHREDVERYIAEAMSPDPELGYVPRPNLVHSTGSHDSDGLRIAPSSTGAGDRPPILATGDSFAYGAEVGDSEAWPSYLQEMLGLRVLNGGVPGYGFDQTVLRTERLARALRPQVIVASFIADDIRRIEFRRFVGFAKPYLVQTEGRLTPGESPVPPPPPAPTTLAAWERYFGWSMLLSTVLSRLGPPEDWPYDSVRVLPPGAGEAMVCQLMRRLAALGVPVLVVAQYEVGAWSGGARHAAEQRRLSAAALSCAKEAGLATLDTFALLDEHGARRLFMPDGHLSAEGNRLTASAIADRLGRLDIPLQ